MKAFNRRKTPREIRLFLTKGKKLSFTKTETYTRYTGENTTCSDNGVFRYSKGKVHRIIGSAFKIRSLYNEWVTVCKINGVGWRIKHFEDIHSVKIKDLGLIRKDFSNKNFDKNLFKIVSALRAYKKSLI